jgi:hypothetical protein
LLARPTEGFPDLFGKNAFLKQHPYFLPCAVPATFSFIAWLVTFLFFKETLAAPITIRQLFHITKKKANPQTGIESTDTSVETRNETPEEVPEAERPLPLRSLLIPRVLIPAGNLASLSFLEISLRAIQPLFLSTPIHLGGLGLSISFIGTLLSVQGVLGGIFQVFFFARIHDRWGSKKTFMAGIASVIPVFILFPVANALARTQGYSIALWTVMGVQMIAMILLGLSFGRRSLHNLRFFFLTGRYLDSGAIYIFIAAASPNRASMGATNGLSQVCLF